MEIKLSNSESEKFFHNALCNGLSQMSGYGLEFDYKESDYTKAKQLLKARIDLGEVPETMLPLVGKNVPTICIEDVLLEILKQGGKLKFNDIEGDGDYTREIGLAQVHSRVPKTPMKHLIDMQEGNDDADTADVILQTVFFEDVIFG